MTVLTVTVLSVTSYDSIRVGLLRVTNHELVIISGGCQGKGQLQVLASVTTSLCNGSWAPFSNLFWNAALTRQLGAVHKLFRSAG